MAKNLNGRILSDSQVLIPQRFNFVTKKFTITKNKIAMLKNYVTYAYTIIPSLGENGFISTCSTVLKSTYVYIRTVGVA